jgi:predicted CoA-binding protein
MPHQNPPDDALRELLVSANTIAVVGASSDPARPSHRIFAMLLGAGYRVIPVNPTESEVLGQQAYATLHDVKEPVDIVDVFRRAEATPEIADDAVAIGAGAFWLQLGIHSEDAAQRASRGGLSVVTNSCIAVVYARLGVAALRNKR